MRWCVPLSGVGSALTLLLAVQKVSISRVLSAVLPTPSTSLAPCRVVWALQLCFLGVTGLCYALKQIHNYRVRRRRGIGKAKF